MEYKEFLNQITYSLKAAILDSNISLNELSKRTGIKKSRLILLLNGKADIYINDIFSISRVLGLITNFDLNDNHIISEEEKTYWDFRNYEKLISDLKLKSENCDSKDKEYYLSKIKIFQKNDKSYNMLRFFLGNRIEHLMSSVELSISELSDYLNVTAYYLVGVLNGEENYPCSLLFNIISILGNSCSVTFENNNKIHLLEYKAWHIVAVLVRITKKIKGGLRCLLIIFH